MRLRAYVKRREFPLELAVFLFGALTGRTVMMDRVSPFGIALLAGCSMAGLNIHYALPGVLLGTLVLQGEMNLPGAAGAALYYGLLLLWGRLKKNSGKFEKLILLFLADTVLLPAFYTGTLQNLLTGLISMGISVLSALVMQNALRALRTLPRRKVLTDGEQVSISALFGVLLMGVTDVRVYGFSLPLTLLLLFAMVAVLSRGVPGVAVAVALATVLTVGGEFSLSLVGGLAACALAGAVLRSLDRFGVLTGFLTASLLVGTYTYTSPHTINLLNLAAAGAMLALLPKEKMLVLCGYLDANMNRERFARKAMKRMRSSIAADMRATAAVVGEMARLYHTDAFPEEPPDALRQWAVQAAYGACGDCPLKKACWKDRKWAGETLMDLLELHERGEHLCIRRPFDGACRQMQHLVSAAWQAQNQYRVQSALKRQTNLQYAFVNRQLAGVRTILEELAVRITRDRWMDEEMEGLLLRGMDRRGYTVYGVDVLFPDGRLLIHIRVPGEQLYDVEPFTGAMEQVLHRPLRVLWAEVEGKQCTLTVEEAQQMTATMGTATAPISETGVSGDSTGERRMERGRVLYALSDGMGAGEAAKGESDSALQLLFDLYGAGFSRDVALESVNRLLLSRQQEMYATLDAVYLDLRSGEAEFMKYGAPPSFIYRGSKLHAVCAEALPAGILDEAVPAVSTAKLRRDDTVVLFSDGALDALGDGTQTAITETLEETATSQEAAQKLLTRAMERRREDDMTVMVIRIA